MGGSAPEEFPLLSALGLYAAEIRGDGNCLFNALSDQIYGHQNEHAAIRARVITYMREHAAYYRQFIDVHPGGGIRRNPKRKNVNAYASSTVFLPPSEADIERVFENHLQRMAKGGTYGDNMEISAFSSAFNYDVKIYQRDFAYIVSGAGSGDNGNRPVAHIAYHMWEHYSSIRNLDGPHSGLPYVSPKALSPEEEERQRERLTQTPHILPWQIDVVSKSLPFLADKPTIKRALEAAKGDINAAVSGLMDAEENGSTSSQRESSSIDRDQDSDDGADQAPTKKQDRRMSRASRALRQRREMANGVSRLEHLDVGQDSSASWESESSSAYDSSQPGRLVESDSVDRNIMSDTRDDNAHAADRPPAKPSIRLKLLPPRPPSEAQRMAKAFPGQSGPRISARDRKEHKKQAQKANRKQRLRAEARGDNTPNPPDPGTSLRADGLTATPPVETLRTLYI